MYKTADLNVAKLKAINPTGFLLAVRTCSLLPFVITGVHQAIIASASLFIPLKSINQKSTVSTYLSVAMRTCRPLFR